MLGGLFFGTAIYILTARPDWFFTPDPVPPTSAVHTASVRLMLIREADRLRRYRSVNGELPKTLADAGVVVSGVRYQRSDDSTFRLSFPVATGEIALRSDISTEEFLGNSLEVINHRGE